MKTYGVKSSNTSVILTIVNTMVMVCWNRVKTKLCKTVALQVQGWQTPDLSALKV